MPIFILLPALIVVVPLLSPEDCSPMLIFRVPNPPVGDPELIVWV